jgi:hypothetical protein
LWETPYAYDFAKIPFEKIVFPFCEKHLALAQLWFDSETFFFWAEVFLFHSQADDSV